MEEQLKTEKEVAEIIGVSRDRVGQLRRGRVVRRSGRVEYAEEPALEAGVDYVWVQGRVMYTAAGVDKLKEQREGV